MNEMYAVSTEMRDHSKHDGDGDDDDTPLCESFDISH